MENVLVSCIVPVYDVKEYLEECVASVRAQTVSNWELILVDDGSTDGSAALCDRFAVESANVRVIHQTNAGPSAARNAALDVCRGEWVLFVDADDTLAPDALAVMLRAGEEKQADMVCCEFTEIDAETGAVLHQSTSDAPETFTGREALHRMLDSSRVYVFLCNKLYRRSLIGEDRLPEELRTGEDMLFLTRLLYRAGTVATVPKALYRYRARTTSLARSADCMHAMDAIRSAELVREFVEEHCPEEMPLAWFRLWYSYLTVFDRLLLSGRKAGDPQYEQVRGWIIAARSLIRNCPFLSRKRRRSARVIAYWPSLYALIVRKRAARKANT